MTRRIHFMYKDKEYCLEFTRTTIKRMEAKGFVVADVLNKPMSMLSEFFAGSFLANHPFTRRKEIDEIYEQFDDKGELLNTLAEMYSLVLDDFVNELEKPGKGLKWERS